MTAKHFASLAALGLLLGLAGTGPAQAKNDKTPPGDPCGSGPGVGTGNPCNGNNGNEGPQGNAHHNAPEPDDGVDYDYDPAPFAISRPGNDRGAFITQIGDENRATIRQSTSLQYARIDQSGDRNSGDVSQTGGGAHYALVDQAGDANVVALGQSGAAAQVALLQQSGYGNTMHVDQYGGAVSSGVAASQLGDGNTMSLAQSGDNNQARLVQQGSGNAMTATQTGGNNQLAWTQTGNGLSDLAITQEGGQALQVTQTLPQNP